MSWIPGWDSVVAAGWWSGFYFWAGIAALISLGAFEVASHRYSDRKDELAAIEQEAVQRHHDEEMTRLHLEAAQIQEHSAELEKQTNEAKLALARLTTPRQRLVNLAEDQIVKRLSPFPGTSYDFGYSIGSGEQANFLWSFRLILEKAHWIQVPWKGPGLGISFGNTGLPVSGSVGAQNVEIHLHPESREALKPAANALITSLNEAGVSASDGGFNTSNENTGVIHILVGEVK